MNQGPKINEITKQFSSRDSLGIEGVATSISAELCPVINTVTPRAFYWPFMCWIYYDFYENSGIKDRSVTVFDKDFLKRQDYFFVLANLLNEATDQVNLVGKQKTAIDIIDNPSGPYPFNPNYFLTRYGGMQYYNAGCLTLQFITDEDESTGKTFTLPQPTQYGVEMAHAFENVIKDTTYFRQYRLKNTPVPKEVLLEYGSRINITMDGFDECKRLLKKHLFQRSRRLTDSAEYARLISLAIKKTTMSVSQARRFLYDYYSPRGEKNHYPDHLKDTVTGWEIAVGRNYFTVGLEMIWKYMLAELAVPMTIENWIDNVIHSSKFTFMLSQPLNQILQRCDFTYNEREHMAYCARRSKRDEYALENGLLLALSSYNRFMGRDDLENTHAFLDVGKGRIPGTGSISFGEWFALIDRFKSAPAQDFLFYVLRECIVEQHVRTCFEKLTRPSQSVDGFYFERIGKQYIKNEHEFQFDFQGIRFVQLMQVMNDLNMFGADA